VTYSEDIRTAFENGNFTQVILKGSPEQWQWHAALGLIGRTDEALVGLSRFRNPEARFYEGVALWMAGDELEAKRVLAKVPTAHAQQLLSLISKPSIRVLSMLPSDSFGPHLTLRGALTDPKFDICNCTSADDLSFNSKGGISRAFDFAPPDFFVCQMIEWFQIPRLLTSFKCPTIGHTSDFDLHIQGLYHWLNAFDEILVSDHDEHAAVVPLTKAPVSVFPKVFACPASLPRPLRREQKFDVFLSGTLFHPWHPDKARLLQELLGVDGLRVLGFNGYLPENQYYETLSRSRICVAYYRRDGGMLTRAIESAAMGCVTMVPHGSVVNLFTEPRGALVEYETSGDGIVRCVKAVLEQYDKYERIAWKAASGIRQELASGLVGSQYTRFCTYLAARPRQPRQAIAPRDLDQRHLVILKGWRPAGGDPKGMRKLAAANATQWRQSLRAEPDKRFAALSNILRERLLMYLHLLAFSRPADSTTDPLKLERSDFPRPGVRARLIGDLRRACAEFPDRLVLTFNYLRAAIHVGSDLQLADARQFLTATLARPSSYWRVEPEDDVLPYDIFPLCFNYRSYLDTVVECLSGRQSSSKPLGNLILGSLFYYRARLLGTIDDAQTATRLDPTFPFFALEYGKLLSLSAAAEDRQGATHVLVPLVERTMVAGEAWAVLCRLGYDRHAHSLAARVKRIQDGLIAAEQYSWGPLNILSAVQSPGLSGAIGPRLLPNPRSGHNATRFSVLFIDHAFRHWRQHAQLLAGQTIPRGAYEAIVADAYDQAPSEALDIFDKVILSSQNEFLAHESIAANYAAITAQSGILLVVDGAPDIESEAFARLVAEVEAGAAQAVVVNSTGGRMLACRRQTLFDWGGFDEHPIYCGSGSLVGALCERLADAGITVVSHSGPVPDADLSSVRRDFLAIIQGSKLSEHRRNRLLPLKSNELISARSAHRDVFDLMSIKPFVEKRPNGYYVPRHAPQDHAIYGPYIDLPPGHYRWEWTAKVDQTVDPTSPLGRIDVTVNMQEVTARSLTAGELSNGGYLDFSVIRKWRSKASVCEFRIWNGPTGGWTLTGVWLTKVERSDARILQQPVFRWRDIAMSRGKAVVRMFLPIKARIALRRLLYRYSKH
jgi:hypothetical protein